MLVATIAVSPLLATDLLGRSGENSMTVRQVLPPGTSLQATSDEASKIEESLKGIEGIKDVQVTSGNAQTGFAALTSTGSSNSTFTIVTDEKINQGKLQDEVRSRLEGGPPEKSLWDPSKVDSVLPLLWTSPSGQRTPQTCRQQAMPW